MGVDQTPLAVHQQPPVLELKNVGLEIPVFTTETRSLKSSLLRSVTGGHLKRKGSGAVITALQDINVTIRQSERVALIGHNGAGKTTFLRLLSGIYRHTSGQFKAHLPVFPMIQKSFITSPELSGLQAIKAHFLMVHGHLCGFEAFCDDVISFSGLGDFIHLPLKTYSQGMSARLLFAVLTGVSHDCLAMDEGFGAGDTTFYEKAEERMNRFLSSAGTLLLASHSDALLRRFCRHGLVFDSGRLVFSGPLESALEYYHRNHASSGIARVAP